jgi:ABC-type amino acid transport substrate-binding protein
MRTTGAGSRAVTAVASATRPLARAVAAGLLLLAVASGARSQELVVGVKAAPPFAMRAADGGWEGVSVELWRRVAEATGLEYRLEERDLAGLFAGLDDGSLDVGLGALTVTSEREQHVDFSHPFFNAGLGIAVARRPGSWLRLLRGDSLRPLLEVLATLAAVLLVAGAMVWIFERGANPEQFGGDALRGLGSAFWWAAVTMTTVGYGDKAPRTLSGRLIALVWMFASLLLISGFIAAISPALTSQSLTSSVSGLDDLTRVRVGAPAGATSADFLSTRGIAFRGFTDAAAAVEALAAGQLEAVVYDAPLLQHTLTRAPGSAGLRVLPGEFERQSYAIALRDGSPLRERINVALLAVLDDPDWARLLRRYLG